MAKLPYFAWYPADFAADTRDMNDDEELLYRRFLDAQWLSKRGTLPLDERELAHVLGYQLRKFRRCFAIVSTKLCENSTRCFHASLKDQWDDKKRIQRLRKMAGRASAQVVHKQTSNSLEPDPVREVGVDRSSGAGKRSVPTKPVPVKPQPRRARQTSIDPNWAPDEGAKNYCIKRGYPRAELHTERFVKHHVAKGNRYAKWQAAFLNWVRDDSPGGQYHSPEKWERLQQREKEMQRAEATKTTRNLEDAVYPTVPPRTPEVLSVEQRNEGRRAIGSVLASMNLEKK
jgi:uncharacterized protein YdaU (DUF1376 family)